MYGLNPQRTRYLPARGVKPPFHKLWRYTERPLLEFPPIYVGGILYVGQQHAASPSRSTPRTGKAPLGTADRPPQRLLARLLTGTASTSSTWSPATSSSSTPKPAGSIWKKRAAGAGRVLAGGGRQHASTSAAKTASSTRSAPSTATSAGRPRSAGPVKSAPAYYGGRLYVGDYGGYMNAVDAKTGKLIWQSGSLGPGFGGSGQFYSTPAVAFGRVYAGNNDGRVYSFDIADGDPRLDLLDRRLRLLRRRPSPAPGTARRPSTSAPSTATSTRSTPRTAACAGAARPAARWSARSRRSATSSTSPSSPTRRRPASMMRSGRRVFRYPKGTYTPVISDGRRLYLTGYSSITALRPVRDRQRISNNFVAPKPRCPTHARRERAQQRLAAPR